MKYLERYTGKKAYMFPNGRLATPEVMLEKYESILIFPHFIETDERGEICWSIQSISAARTQYDIDPGLTDDEAIIEIQRIINTPPIIDDTPGAEERMAAAMEFQNMLALASIEDQMEGGESA